MLMRKHLSLLLLLCCPPAFAQELELEAPVEVRRYTVEVIIFAYAQEVSTGSEIFVPETIVVEEIDLETLPAPAEMAPTHDAFVDGGQVLERDLVLLDEQDFTLVEVYEMLDRLAVYEPLMHFGWTQTTWPAQDKEALSLTTFGTSAEGLDGELTLYLSRYLHLVVNLTLDAPQSDDEVRSEPEFAYGDYRTLNELRDPLQPGPVRYRIEENRIFRSGELRYFDHPKFGVLAKVTRLEEEEPEEELEGELLGYPLE